jgi:hypothetical protein
LVVVLVDDEGVVDDGNGIEHTAADKEFSRPQKYHPEMILL